TGGPALAPESSDATRHASQSADPSVRLISSIPVDPLLDDHATEFEKCRRWASSDAGQIARVQNPAGIANLHAHAAHHAAVLACQQPAATPVVGIANRRAQLRTYASDEADTDIPDTAQSQDAQNRQNPQSRQTPQSLTAQIPAAVRAEISRAIT